MFTLNNCFNILEYVNPFIVLSIYSDNCQSQSYIKYDIHYMYPVNDYYVCVVDIISNGLTSARHSAGSCLTGGGGGGGGGGGVIT